MRVNGFSPDSGKDKIQFSEIFTPAGKRCYIVIMADDDANAGAVLIINGRTYVPAPAELVALMPGLKSASGLPADVLAAIAAQPKSAYRILRRHRGMQQTDLAGAVGITPSAMAQIENGGGVTPKNLMALAKALGVPADLLLAAVRDD